MSHVKRKDRRRPPGRAVRKKQKNRREWLSFLLILIIFVSVIAAVFMIAFSGNN